MCRSITDMQPIRIRSGSDPESRLLFNMGIAIYDIFRAKSRQRVNLSLRYCAQVGTVLLSMVPRKFIRIGSGLRIISRHNSQNCMRSRGHSYCRITLKHFVVRDMWTRTTPIDFHENRKYADVSKKYQTSQKSLSLIIGEISNNHNSPKTEQILFKFGSHMEGDDMKAQCKFRLDPSSFTDAIAL